VTPASAPRTPGGAPSLSRPQSAIASPAQAQGRAGLLDKLAQAALARGDTALYNERIAQKQKLRAEGVGEAAHILLSGGSAQDIERAFNANGSMRIMPGTLTINPDKSVSATIVDPATGKTTQKNDYNLIHAAMAMGMIAPPTIQSHPATDRQTIIGPDGNVQVLSEGGKYAAVAIRNVGAYVYNQTTGTGHIETPDGGTALLNPTQAAGMREIAQINNQVAGRRAQQIPGKEDNKPQLDESRVIGDASAIWLNNPGLMRSGKLNPGRAHEIAVAINDKDPAAALGQSEDPATHRMWNVVKYKGVTYAISEAAAQPKPATPTAAATGAPAAPPAAANAAPAAAVPVPRPAAPTPAAAPATPAPAAAAPAAPGAVDEKLERYGAIKDRLASLDTSRGRSAGNAQADAAYNKMTTDLRAQQNALNVSESQYQDYTYARKLSVMQAQYDTAVKLNGAKSNQALNLKAQIDKLKASRNKPNAYAKGGVVQGGRGGAPVAAEDLLKKVQGTTNVKSRSFAAPPRAAAAAEPVDEAPVVRKMTPAPEIVGKPLTDDGVEVRPMTQQEQPEGAPLDDGVEVKLMKDPNDEQQIVRRPLKRPPARQTYMAGQ
jgi:hypothetical protein